MRQPHTAGTAPESPECDVVVVGAGPAGAATAIWLARAGRRVTMLDRAHFPRDKPCGEYLNPGVVDALRRIGMLDAVIDGGVSHLRGMHIRHGSTDFLVDYVRNGDPELGIGVRRSVLDSTLVAGARDAGVTVLEGVRATGLERDATGTVTGVASSDGTGGEDAICARFTVGADGRNSMVSRALGLDARPRGPQRMGLVAHYTCTTVADVGQMFVGESSYCGIAAVGNGAVSVGLVVPMGIKPAGQSTQEFFDAQLDFVPGVTDCLAGGSQVGAISGAAPLARRVSHASGPGYVLVGDAAGFLDPFTGEGIHRALRGAELAADAIDTALERQLTSADGYDEARVEAFRSKDRVCLLVQTFLRSERGLDYALRRLARRPHVSRVFSDVLGDYRPAGDALRPGIIATLLRP